MGACGQELRGKARLSDYEDDAVHEVTNEFPNTRHTTVCEMSSLVAAFEQAVLLQHCGTGGEHAIADLVCDLGHLAEARGFDFLSAFPQCFCAVAARSWPMTYRLYPSAPGRRDAAERKSGRRRAVAAP